MHGGDLVAKVIKEQGVTALFTLCGGHISPILAGCKSADIKVIDVRHEASAAFAADAYARLTGTPGVAAVTAGPGVTNTLTALKNAQLAQSPLILLGGATATVLKDRGSLQDIDQMSLIKPHVKAAFQLSKVKEIVPTLRKTFRIALDGVPGPVFIELPMDLLYPETMVKEWYGIKSGEQAAEGLQKKAVQMYLNFHAQRMFKNSDKVSEHSLVDEMGEQLDLISHSATRAIKTHPQLSIARQLIQRAKQPILVVGSQATLSAADINTLVSAIEKLDLPVFLSGMARGLLGVDNPLQLKHKRKLALREADLVILAGVPCDFRLDYGNHISHKAKIISLNRSKKDLTKNRRPTIGIHDDPASCLSSIAEGFTQSSSVDRRPWWEVLRTRDWQREEEINQQASELKEHINPLALLKEIDKVMDRDAIIVADGGDFVGTASYILKPRKPLSWLDPGVFGTLGVGGGFTLGAASVHPRREIWLIYGDGSSAYSLAEFDTYVRLGFSVIAVVGNDAAWNQIARDQVDFLGDDVGTVLRHTNYHDVAQGYGGLGLFLDKAGETESVLAKAKEQAKEGKPVLINAILDRSDFRKGSISV